MINIPKGRYWDFPWSLVSGCAPCSPGCDHCWSAAMSRRFGKYSVRWTKEKEYFGEKGLVGADGKFSGTIIIHPERMSIPLKRKKPTVFSVWNDLFHEDVPFQFIDDVFDAVIRSDQHTYLVLTKRPQRLYEWADSTGNSVERILKSSVYLGLTVCNQQEADEKIPVFLQVPGKKFLSIEPMLGAIDISSYLPAKNMCARCGWMPVEGMEEYMRIHGDTARCIRCRVSLPAGSINAVILGGETGPGARPMHPNWVRKVRDDCAAAGVPFFFKQWGEWAPSRQEIVEGCTNHTNGHYWYEFDPECKGNMRRIGRKKAGRILDGRTHDELVWVVK